jgi:hypothetical protein
LEACCNIQSNEQRYDQQEQPCNDANSACVSSKDCFNGYIDQSAELKASIPNSVSLSYFFFFFSLSLFPKPVSTCTFMMLSQPLFFFFFSSVE